MSPPSGVCAKPMNTKFEVETNMADKNFSKSNVFKDNLFIVFKHNCKNKRFGAIFKLYYMFFILFNSYFDLPLLAHPPFLTPKYMTDTKVTVVFKHRDEVLSARNTYQSEHQEQTEHGQNVGCLLTVGIFLFSFFPDKKKIGFPSILITTSIAS